MESKKVVRHKFVKSIPRELEDGVIYISVEYGTAVHMCCCGCGERVVMSLTFMDWKMTYDGESITLDPLIGNWEFECGSHYWISRNRVRWSRKFTTEEILEGRELDRRQKRDFFAAKKRQVFTDNHE